MPNVQYVICRAKSNHVIKRNDRSERQRQPRIIFLPLMRSNCGPNSNLQQNQRERKRPNQIRRRVLSTDCSCFQTRDILLQDFTQRHAQTLTLRSIVAPKLRNLNMQRALCDIAPQKATSFRRFRREIQLIQRLDQQSRKVIVCTRNRIQLTKRRGFASIQPGCSNLRSS